MDDKRIREHARELDDTLTASMGIDAEDRINAAMHALLSEAIAEYKEDAERMGKALQNLLVAAESLRHGGHRDALVMAYDGWAREARSVLDAARKSESEHG